MEANDILNQIYKVKDIIILAGLGVGALSVFSRLPDNLLGLGDTTRYIYLGIIIAAGVLYAKLYYGSIRITGFQRTTISRDLSSRSHLTDLSRQRGGASTRIPMTSEAQPNKIPVSEDIVKEFNK